MKIYVEQHKICTTLLVPGWRSWNAIFKRSEQFFFNFSTCPPKDFETISFTESLHFYGNFFCEHSCHIDIEFGGKLKIVSQKWKAFVFGNTYFHQIFTECLSNQYTHFDILTYRIWLQVMEGPLILLRFWVFLYIID